MKKTVFLFLTMVFLVGCIEIVPKQMPTNNNESDQNLFEEPKTTPDQNSLDENTQQTTEPTEPIPPPEPPQPPPANEPVPDPPANEPPPPLIDPPRPRTEHSWVELLLNTDTVDLPQGGSVEVDGTGNFSGQKLSVFVDSILITGEEFGARLEVKNESGEVIGRNTFFAGEELFFETTSGDKITFDALLIVEAVHIG